MEVEQIQGEMVRWRLQLFYSGADERGRNGVGIVVSKELKDNLVSVSKTNDRVSGVSTHSGARRQYLLWGPYLACHRS